MFIENLLKYTKASWAWLPNILNEFETIGWYHLLMIFHMLCYYFKPNKHSSLFALFCFYLSSFVGLLISKKCTDKFIQTKTCGKCNINAPNSKSKKIAKLFPSGHILLLKWWRKNVMSLLFKNVLLMLSLLYAPEFTLFYHFKNG